MYTSVCTYIYILISIYVCLYIYMFLYICIFILGSFTDEKLSKKFILTEEDHKTYEKWEFISKRSFQEEVVDFLTFEETMVSIRIYVFFCHINICIYVYLYQYWNACILLG
jgi:hypothetical protein